MNSHQWWEISHHFPPMVGNFPQFPTIFHQWWEISHHFPPVVGNGGKISHQAIFPLDDPLI